MKITFLQKKIRKNIHICLQWKNFHKKKCIYLENISTKNIHVIMYKFIFTRRYVKEIMYEVLLIMGRPQSHPYKVLDGKC